jgi:PAS domain S-box-containing protein
LRNTRNYLDSLLNYANAPIIVWDNAKRITLFNNAFEALTGHKKESMLGRNIDILFPPLQKEEILQTIQGATKGEKWKSVEISLLCKDKETKIALWNSANIADEEGKIVATIAQGQDITERRKAEQALKESEEKYRSLVELAPDGIVVVSTEGIVTSVSRSFLTLLGYDSEEGIVGKPFTELMTMRIEDIPRFQGMFMSLMKGESPSPSEFLYVRRDGTSRWAEVHPSLMIKDGNPVGVQAIMRDVSERKKMEEEIRSLARFPSENPNSVLRVNREGVVLYANNPGKALLQDWEHEVADSAPEFLRNVVAETLSKQSEKSFDLKLGKQVYSVTVTPVMDSNYANIYGMDITERRKAEEQLKESENKYRELFETSIDAIATSDMDGHFIDCNQSCQKMLGYSLDEMKKLTYQQLTPEKWHEKEAEIIEKDAMKKGYTAEYEKELIRKDGAIIPVSNRVWATFDDDGKPKAMWGIVRDITERKLVERTLRESEEKLRSIVENSSDQIFMLDRDGKFLSINKTAADLSGMSPQEMIGRPISEIFPEAIAAKFSRNIKNVFDTGKSMFIDEKMVVKGREFYNSTSLNPVRDIRGRVTAVTGIVRDITERKKTEKILEESEERFRAIFEGVNDGILLADTKAKRFFFANPRICEITGYSLKELLKLGIGDIHPKKDLPYVIDSFTKQAQGKQTLAKDIPVLRKDERVVYCDISARSVKIGSQKYLIGLFRDVTEERTRITELKNTEERLKETNMRLEVTNEKLHVVGGLTRHDVRNKLSAVTGNAYLLRQKLAEDPKALEQLKDMEAAVRLVEKIFEFASNYEKLGVEKLAYMDVGKAVGGAVSLFSDLKGVKVGNECGGLTVLADSLLNQLFYNLVDNSLKYGEKIRQIKIHYKMPSADQLELIYEDDGVGIPDKMRSNLFKEGFTSGKGTGYGLFMIKRICDVYGWTIQETSKQGKGAQFTMLVPRIGSTGKANYQIQKPRQE